MKYTSPFKPNSNNKSPKHNQSTFQVSPSKDSPFLYNTQSQNMYRFQSKTNPIPYFQNSKYKVTEKSQQSPYKSRQKDRQNSSDDRLGKIGKLLENITNKHQQMKNKITNLKQTTSKYQDNQEECTFSPHIIHNPKYIIPSSLDDRTKQWGQSRARHYTSIKQELVTQQVKQCTFSPKLISKPRSIKILKEKALEQRRMKQEKGESYSKSRNTIILKKIDDKKMKKEAEKMQYHALDIKNIKELIKYEVNRIKFDY